MGELSERDMFIGGVGGRMETFYDRIATAIELKYAHLTNPVSIEEAAADALNYLIASSLTPFSVTEDNEATKETLDLVSQALNSGGDWGLIEEALRFASYNLRRAVVKNVNERAQGLLLLASMVGQLGVNPPEQD